MTSISVPALLTALAFTALYALYRVLLPRPIPGIPCNKDSAGRIAGDIPYLLELQNAGKRPQEFWGNLCRSKQSPIVQFFPGPFGKPVVVVSDYREARDVLTRRTKAVDKGALVRLIWSGVMPTHFIGFNSRHPITSESKALVKDLIGIKYLATISAPIIYNNIMDVIELWSCKTKIAQQRPFQIMDDICFLTGDIIFETALGITGKEKALVRQLAQLQQQAPSIVAGKDDSDVECSFPKHKLDGLLNTIVRLTNLAGGVPTAPFPPLFWPLTNLRPSVRKLRKQAFDLISRHISKEMSRWKQQGEPKAATNALQFMIGREIEAAEKQGRRPDVQRQVFHDALYGYCIGGQDTMHSTLSFLVKCLGEFPQIQNWLREELDEAFSEANGAIRNPTVEEIKDAKVPRLDAFIEEVMRVYPAAAAIPKEAMEDCNILGHIVPKGTTILFSNLGPSVAEAPIRVSESVRSDSSKESGYACISDIPLSEFQPQRWLHKDPKTGEDVFDSKAAPQMGFSLGPRECWGKRLAYLQLKMFMVLFLFNFEAMELPENLRNWEIDDALNAKPKSCLVKLRKLT